jgi:hypothetical protein
MRRPPGETPLALSHLMRGHEGSAGRMRAELFETTRRMSSRYSRWKQVSRWLDCGRICNAFIFTSRGARAGARQKGMPAAASRLLFRPFAIPLEAHWRFPVPGCSVVLLALPFCVLGVVLISRPTFLFGGTGASAIGVAIACLQVRLFPHPPRRIPGTYVSSAHRAGRPAVIATRHRRTLECRRQTLNPKPQRQVAPVERRSTWCSKGLGFRV